MRLAVRENMVPGATLTEKFRHLQAWGYDAIELTRSSRQECLEEVKQAMRVTGVQVSIVSSIGGGALIEARKEERDRAVQSHKTALEIASELNAVGVISVPLLPTKMQNRPRLPDLSPWQKVEELEWQMMVALYGELADYAQRLGNVVVIVEPLNRYEQWHPNRVEQAVALCRAVGNPHLRTMFDFFHANIEEGDMAEAIRLGGSYLANIHIADSNRLTPPHGHTDFRPCFRALKEIGYGKFMGLECSVVGDPADDLPRCARYLRQLWEEA
ncbi:D-psicose 3-epimerase [bacterium HR17]|uniref:D-psicose 3-epimerase n=1 Tax=Candidatus Fervidibacter japonicus TaxID=2035412 RepID=A0A2H5XF28_9BACT|nr:D-psicose 3-epimerase [bacterium HR17]